MLDRVFRIDFYPQDWIIDTACLPLEERGLYIQIIALIYSNRGPIQNDPQWIAGLSGCSTRMAKKIIEKLIIKSFLMMNSDGKITQKRAENELKSKREHLESSAKGGRKAAEKRAETNKIKDVASSDSTMSVPSSSPPPYPTAIEKKEGDNPPTPHAQPPLELNLKIEHGSEKHDSEFEDFWIGWKPFDMDKGSKANAKKFYLKARKQTEHETIIAKRDEYLAQCHANQRRTTHASTWLNPDGRRGYADEYPNTKPSNPSFNTPQSHAAGNFKDDRLRARINATARAIDDLCGN